jgi:hypothetical protein
MKKHYQHLHVWKTRKFKWGEHDCMLSIANYLLDVTGKDPAEEYRGMYDDRLSCARLTGFHKDPIGLFRRCVEAIGLVETIVPTGGDVGVIDVMQPNGLVTIGALYLGKNWAVQAENGLLICPAIKVHAAWSVS